MGASLEFFAAYTGGWALYFVISFACLSAMCAKSPTFSQKPREAGYLFMVFLPVIVLFVDGASNFRWNAYETWQERIHNREDFAIRLCLLQCVWQVFCFLLHVTGLFKMQFEMLLHHGAVLTLCALVSFAPYSHWSIAFFGGVIEITNVPLTLMDLFKGFKDLQQRYPMVYAISQGSFAVLFYILRVAMWLPIYYTCLMDAKLFIESGDAKGLQLASALYMIPSLGLLTFLQLFWGWKIFMMILKMLGIIKKEKKDKDAKDK